MPDHDEIDNAVREMMRAMNRRMDREITNVLTGTSAKPRIEEPLTAEKLRGVVASLPPAPPLFPSPPNLFAGIPILTVPETHFPLKYAYEAIFAPHPFVAWLTKKLRRMGIKISPWTHRPHFARDDSHVYMLNGMIACSARQKAALVSAVSDA